MAERDVVIAALALWAGWGVSWLAAALWSARSVGRARLHTYGRELGLAFVGFGLLFVGPPVARQPLWLLPSWLGWAMVGMIGVGLTFAWWARIHLGALWSVAIIRREGHRIVDSGPYAIVRHPIYTALILAAVGLAAIKATPMAIAGAGLIALGFTLKARIEETYLAAELGEDAYAGYRRRVPMLIPFVRATP